MKVVPSEFEALITPNVQVGDWKKTPAVRIFLQFWCF